MHMRIFTASLFQNDRPKTVGGVAGRNPEPCTTHHDLRTKHYAPQKANNNDPLLFFDIRVRFV